jgi:hypothetical protein
MIDLTLIFPRYWIGFASKFVVFDVNLKGLWSKFLLVAAPQGCDDKMTIIGIPHSELLCRNSFIVSALSDPFISP